MTSFYAVPYTIHFDDTMAYGSHHFMTGFKFQCAAREAFLFGAEIFDIDGVKDALDRIHLLTLDAYSRNLNSAMLGDRIAILLSLEEWGQASARFCYRAVDSKGRRICAGFQMLVCADAKTGMPMMLPEALGSAMDRLRIIEEQQAKISFRERTLAGGRLLDEVFDDAICEIAKNYLSNRYPGPEVIHLPNSKSASSSAGFTTPATPSDSIPTSPSPRPPQLASLTAAKNFAATTPSLTADANHISNHSYLSPQSEASTRHQPQAWIFVGQGGFDVNLFHQRLREAISCGLLGEKDLSVCEDIIENAWGVRPSSLLRGSVDDVLQSIQNTPSLSQIAIHLQNVLGAFLQYNWLDQSAGMAAVHQRILSLSSSNEIPNEHKATPARLIGHSFGELAAVTVAGCLSFHDSIRAVCSRSQAITKLAPPCGGLLAVLASRENVLVELSLSGPTSCVVAGRNHQEQCVLSGPTSELEQLQERLRDAGIRSVFINSPTSFHHPRLSEAATLWRQQLETLSWHVPQIPVFTPIGRKLLTESDDLAVTLATQLLQPFDFAGALYDTAAHGITTFVDVGSTGAMASIIEKVSDGSWTIHRSTFKASAKQIPREVIAESQLPNESLAASASIELAKSDYIAGASSKTDTGDAALARRDTGEERTQTSQTSNDTSSDANNLPATAIVGMGCILPAGAIDPESLLQCIEQQRLGIVDMRDSDPMWEQDFYSETLTPDRSTSCLFGRVRDEDIVIPQGLDESWFGRLSRTQKLLAIALYPCLHGLDQAKRIVCLVGATADGFEDQDEVASLIYAGVSPAQVSDAAKTEALLQQITLDSVRTAQTPHDAVQEVVDFLIGKGTEVVLVDAACASSLYTVSLGMNLLENDQADAVIAGGVFCPGPGNSCLFSQFKGTTSTGCRPFDKNSNGVVFSEGAAFVTLRKQKFAQELNQNILAVIRAAGLSSDGKSSSANVPQSKGQILSLRRAYERYGLSPESITAIEGHGTSTPVGDSTEIETLFQFFSPLNVHKIPVHSLKGTLGHAGWAAGTASIIAATMYMSRRRFPGQAFFQTPSDSVKKSSEKLNVSPSPVVLPESQIRIAINGFGFGGANAHLVLESPNASQTGTNEPANARQTNSETPRKSNRAEPVIVAFHQIAPTLVKTLANGQTAKQFDRNAIDISKEFIVLPELSDDMDISQKLAALLGKATLAQLPGFSNEQKSVTSIVLAMNEKTERGVEATFRVLYPRLRRAYKSSSILSNLERAYEKSRPSGPYTLQCMMPNVASGRAALLLNLNGPNFVVDSGAHSLSASFECAKLLLNCSETGGTQVVLVEAIKANSGSYPTSSSPYGENEYAFAFAITSRDYANERNWPILAEAAAVQDYLKSIQPVELIEEHLSQIPNTMGANKTKPRNHKAKNDSEKEIAATPSPDSLHPIYTTMWVQKALLTEETATESATSSPLKPSPNTGSVTYSQDIETLFILRANESLLRELQQIIPAGSTHSILLVGADATNLAKRFTGLNIYSVTKDQLDSELDLTNFQTHLAKRHYHRIIAINSPSSWNLSETVTELSQNELCEATFLTLQSMYESLNARSVSVWHLAIDGWNRCVHPSTGAVAGTLKAIRREFPGLSCGNVYTQGLTLPQAVQLLDAEVRANTSDPEVLYKGEQRWVRRLVQTDNKERQGPALQLTRDSVVLATGGAKGVTAVMLQALAEKFKCKIIALGRSELQPGPANEKEAETEFYRELLKESPKPTPIQMKQRFERLRSSWEAHAAIESLKKQGSIVEYYAADIQNESQIDEIIRGVSERHGRIDLVIHGAGVQFSKRLQDRTLSDFRRTFGTKVYGLEVLYKAIKTHVRNEVVFHPLTSAFSIFGNDGQHDYGAANETLDRMCEFARTHHASRWFSIAWLAWDGIGMTRGSEYQALAEQRGLSGMTAVQGQAIFMEALQGRTDSAINVPMTSSEHTEYDLQTVPSLFAPSNSTTVYEFSCDASHFPCLPAHLVRGIPTLPGAWMLELFVKCAYSIAEDNEQLRSVVLCDSRFMRFVKPSHDNTPDIRVVIEQEGEQYRAFLIQNVRHPSGRLLIKDVVCSQTTIQFFKTPVHKSVQLRPSESALPSESLTNSPIKSDPYCGSESIVALSGEFDCLRNIKIGKRLRSATLHPTLFQRWPAIIPATELDAAWRLGAMYAIPSHAKVSSGLMSQSIDSLFAPTAIQEIWLPIIHPQEPPTGHGWKIQSTNPIVSGLEEEPVSTPNNGTPNRTGNRLSAFWKQTDVIDSAGQLQMRVSSAQAYGLQ